MKADISTVNTSSDVLPIFTTVLLNSTFENVYGTTLDTILTGIISSNITLVKCKPIVALTSLTRAGNNAVYKFIIAANGGDIKLGTGIFTITNNTDTTGSFLTGTLWLGNEGGTSLWVVSANGTAIFDWLSTLVNITDGTTANFTLVIPVSNWYKSIVKGNIGIEVNNISYIDIFPDATENFHSNIFTTFKWDIAPVSTSAVVE